MRFDKFTIKSQELIQNAQSLAAGRGHQQIEPEHLMVSMLAEKGGITRSILNKLGVSPDTVANDLVNIIEAFPSVSGSQDVYLSSRTRTILDNAFTEA